VSNNPENSKDEKASSLSSIQSFELKFI
jgi:hypothetical protein